jgi:acetylornithine/succinyldiaminopimelate/putrescine aminotransferase
VQGEGGITPATPQYLLGLRQLCDEKKLLLLMDSVQCGHFRTGRCQSWQRILEGVPGAEGFLPDAISMAKSMGPRV